MVFAKVIKIWGRGFVVDYFKLINKFLLFTDEISAFAEINKNPR